MPRDAARLVLILLLAFSLLPAYSQPGNTSQPASPRFLVTFTRDVTRGPWTGRIYVMLGREGDAREPRFGPNWFNPQPFVAMDVKDKRPGDAVEVGGPGTLAFPRPLDRLEPGTYVAQAVLDKNTEERDFSNAPGNGYSAPVRVTIGGASVEPARLVIDKTVPPHAFQGTERVKEVDIESPLLSRFYGKPTRVRAAVILPEGYAHDGARRYPVAYVIPGFGGRHYGAAFAQRLYPGSVGVPLLRVVLDPDCALGHHVFADSANNGPRGRALVEELIPHIEKTYRAIGKPWARFVAGHSSGGWSSLWLQVTYPDFFGGVWSTSPDPVDFRDFQRIDLYAKDANLFTDEQGRPRPLARRGTTPVLWYKAFSDMETVIGDGGQLASFEAVFSPRGADGRPRPLWDRRTGKVDPQTARAWERYDIRLVLLRNWTALAPKLKGKLHIYTGELDTFYLEGAVRLLKDSLAGLGSDARIEIVPGKDHGTLLDGALRERIAREMAETFRKGESAGQ